jgi:hypothetical protein
MPLGVTVTYLSYPRNLPNLRVPWFCKTRLASAPAWDEFSSREESIDIEPTASIRGTQTAARRYGGAGTATAAKELRGSSMPGSGRRSRSRTALHIS